METKAQILKEVKILISQNHDEIFARIIIKRLSLNKRSKDALNKIRIRERDLKWRK